MPRETKATRYKFIEQKIMRALQAAQFDPRYDMLLESEEIYEAAEYLEQSQFEFSEGKITEDDVRARYKVYIALHEVPPPAQSGLEFGAEQVHSAERV